MVGWVRVNSKAFRRIVAGGRADESSTSRGPQDSAASCGDRRCGTRASENGRFRGATATGADADREPLSDQIVRSLHPVPTPVAHGTRTRRRESDPPERIILGRRAAELCQRRTGCVLGGHDLLTVQHPVRARAVSTPLMPDPHGSTTAPYGVRSTGSRCGSAVRPGEPCGVGRPRVGIPLSVPAPRLLHEGGGP